MSGALQIAWVELSRRWTLFAVALLVGIVPMVVIRTSDALASTCMLGAALLSWIIAFVIGMTLVGRQLHDGRLSFFFTRPVSGLAIAAGKVGGGLALVLGMELVLLAPTLALENRLAGYREFASASGPIFAIGMAVVFYAAGLVVGVLSRSRSRWFLLDAIGATATSLLAIAILDRINEIGGWMTNIAKLTPEQAEPILVRIDRFLPGLALAAVSAVMVAVIVAVAIGRTDRDRVHRALSITLWSSALAIGGVGLAIGQWGLV